MPGHGELAGVLAANIAYTGAFYVYFLLEQERLGDWRKACLSCLLFGIFPGSVYFSAAYSESTMLLAVLLAIYWTRRNRVGWAGIVSGLAAVARPPGFTLPVSLFIAYYNKWDKKMRIQFTVLSSIFLCVFLGYLQWKFGNMLIFTRMEGLVYKRHFIFLPLLIIKELQFGVTHQGGTGLLLVNLWALGVAFVVLCQKGGWVPKSYSLLSLLILGNNGLFADNVEPMFGMFRYILVLPGIYLLVTDMCVNTKRKWMITTVLIVFVFFAMLIGISVGQKAFIS